MNETSTTSSEHPLFPLFHEFGVMERLIELMLEGRSSEVLCIAGPLLGPYMGLTTAASDKELLDALMDHVWSEIHAESEAAQQLLEGQRGKPMIPHVLALLKEKAPPERLWAFLEGIAYTQRSKRPRLHAMIMLNLLTEEAGMAARQTSTPN